MYTVNDSVSVCIDDINEETDESNKIFSIYHTFNDNRYLFTKLSWMTIFLCSSNEFEKILTYKAVGLAKYSQ